MEDNSLIVLTLEAPVVRSLALGQLIFSMEVQPDLVIHEWGQTDMYVRPEFVEPVYTNLKTALRLHPQWTIELTNMRYGMSWFVARGTADRCVKEFKGLFPERKVRIFEAS